jgi:hypothetical protein
MWRFLGGLAFGAGLGAVVSAFIASPQLAYSDAGADPAAFHILHQVTRLDRLEDDQLASVSIEKPVVSVDAAVTKETHHKPAASAHKMASNRQIKSPVIDPPSTRGQQDVNQAMVTGMQGSGAGANGPAIYPLSGYDSERGKR